MSGLFLQNNTLFPGMVDSIEAKCACAGNISKWARNVGQGAGPEVEFAAVMSREGGL